MFAKHSQNTPLNQDTPLVALSGYSRRHVEKIDGIYQSCNDEKHDLEFQKAIRSVIYEMENNISKVSPKVIECIDNRLSKFLTVNKHHEETSTSSSSIDTSNDNNNTVCIENNGKCNT